MGIFDDFARTFASGGFNPQTFGGPGYEAVWAQLKPWLARISTNGVLRWLPRAASQMPCQIPQYDQGIPVGPCEHTALETSLLCGRPVCLNHSFIDGQQGDAVCYLCIVEARARAAGQAPPPPPPPADEAPPPPDARAEAAGKAWWARGVLGVQEGVTWDAVKAQYRKLSAQFHPDRPTGDERRFKDVQTAYTVLKTLYGEN